MCRTIVAASVVLFLCGTAQAEEKDYSQVEVTAAKVAGSVYMLQGDGGNIGVSVGEDGIVIVDDQYAPLAGKIKAALKGISDKPVRMVINTHHHMDHTGGNEIFQAGAPVIAHDNVRKRLEAGGPLGNGVMKMSMPPSTKGALPIITFDRSLTVHLNGEDIRALHYPQGHTDGDAIIFFTKSNVVHMGDDFVTYGFPFIDLAGGGSIDGMILAVDNVIATLPADTKVIPGHGPVSTIEDMKKYLDMLRGTRSAVAKSINRGATLDQMKTQKLLDHWKSYSSSIMSTEGFIEALYNDLTAGKVGNTTRPY